MQLYSYTNLMSFNQYKEKGLKISREEKRMDMFQESVTTRNMSRRRQKRKIKEESDYENGFKSPNLEAERRRREKLHGRLMALRSHVPVVTNMTKASIVEDAITYIGELQEKVENLTKKLHEMEAPEIQEHQELELIKSDQILEFKEEMTNLRIQENVQVTKIGERKYWLKMITEKKDGIFTKLMEVMSFIGFEIIDISFTKASGAILISSSLQIPQGLYEGSVDDLHQQTKDLLLEVLRRNP